MTTFSRMFLLNVKINMDKQDRKHLLSFQSLKNPLQVEEMNVCDNLGDHLVGNVYVKFKKEDVG